jgi:hypothetical protein
VKDLADRFGELRSRAQGTSKFGQGSIDDRHGTVREPR